MKESIHKNYDDPPLFLKEQFIQWVIAHAKGGGS